MTMEVRDANSDQVLVEARRSRRRLRGAVRHRQYPDRKRARCGCGRGDRPQVLPRDRATETAGVFVAALAVVALTFFLASLRHTLSRTDEGRHLANVVTAGGAVYAVGLMLMAALMVALVDAANHHLTGTAQTLNVLSNDMWVPVVVGLSLLGLGTGVSALRSATLPTWLGWASVVFGILALAGPAGAIAFLLAAVWALVTGIVIVRSSRTTTALADPVLAGSAAAPRAKPFPASDLGHTFTCSAVPRLRGAAEHPAKVAELVAPSRRTEVREDRRRSGRTTRTSAPRATTASGRSPSKSRHQAELWRRLEVPPVRRRHESPVVPGGRPQRGARGMPSPIMAMMSRGSRWSHHQR